MMVMGPSCDPEVRHGGQCRLTMFTKQVSRPVDGLDPPSTPLRPRRVERTRRETWSRARSDVLVALQGARRSSGSRWELEPVMTDKSVGPSPCARRDGGRRPSVPYTTHASMPLFVANVLISRAG
jgi:hypothetical protein